MQAGSFGVQALRLLRARKARAMVVGLQVLYNLRIRKASVMAMQQQVLCSQQSCVMWRWGAGAAPPAGQQGEDRGDGGQHDEAAALPAGAHVPGLLTRH